MNTADLGKKLLAAARTNPAAERVPYAFEKRILARLSPMTRIDSWTQWSGALWRAVAPCAAIMLLSVAWFYFEIDADNTPVALDLALEHTLLAATDTTGEAW